MALAEKLIKEHVTRTPERYASRVRWMAVIYIALNVLSLTIIVVILWRVQFFIALAQRSNVETLVLVIVMVLAIYYIVSTFRGLIGAVRMAWLNLPKLGAQDAEAIEKVERRKHAALSSSREPKSAYFDLAVRLAGRPEETIKWEVGDGAGKLGQLEVDGVEIKYYPLKDGMNASIFEFVTDQIEEAVRKRDAQAKLQITQWSTIDEDQAAAYHRMVQAFQNLERVLAQGNVKGKKGEESEPAGRVWPSVEITQEDVDEIGGEIRKLVPTLRSESLLPDVEYEVEWTIPVLPEPLGFMQLTRRENRADAVVTMGCAMFVMLAVLLIVLLFIIWPPWVPSK